MLPDNMYQTAELAARHPLGAIYKAIPERSKDRYLVKVFAPPVTLPEELTHDLFLTLEEESLSLENVLSDRILPVLSVDKSPGRIIVTVDYPDYTPLAHYVQQKAPLSFKLIHNLMEQIRHIMEKFLNIGLHRFQIEPDMMLIKTKQRHLLYPDTALVNLAKYPEMIRMGYLDGKPQFIPPEILKGQDLSSASEVYVIGVFMYYLLTGILPFAELPLAAAAALCIHEPLPPVNRFKDTKEKKINTLVARATRKNPLERLSSPEELLEEFRKIAS